MTAAEISLLLAGAVLAGFVQGVAGFGFALVAMSVWVWGLPPQTAAVMAVAGSLVGQVVAAFAVRRSLAWTAMAPMLAGGLAGIPLGVWLLPRLDPVLFKFCLGLLLVTACPALLRSAAMPPRAIAIRPARWSDALAGMAGGTMGGLGGFTGVVPALWTSFRGLPKEDQRTLLQNFNLATLAVAMASYGASGMLTAAMWPLLPVLTLAVSVLQDLGQEVLGARAALLGLAEEGVLGAVLDDAAGVHEDDAVADLAGEAHLVRDAHHGHALLGQLHHHVEHLADHLGVERRGGLVEQHDDRVHASARAMATRCCWPPESWPGNLSLCAIRPTRSSIFMPLRLRLVLAALEHLDLGQVRFSVTAQVREQLEVLEHHADAAAQLGQVGAWR
jgi:uncharacterized membrane protein YfcA